MQPHTANRLRHARPWRTVLGTILFAAAASAQSPAAESKPVTTADVALQSLDALSNAGVYVVQSLRTGAARPQQGNNPQGNNQEPEPPAAVDARQGSSAARLWANVQDARFHRDGRMLALLVEAPTIDPRGADGWRVLPAASVRWDTSRGQWVLNEPHLQFVELEAAGAAKPGAAPTQVPAARQDSLLASQLVHATIESLPAGAAPSPVEAADAVEEATRATQAPSFWFAPSAQRLAFVVVPVDVLDVKGERAVKHVPLPWSVVRLGAAGANLQVTLAARREQLQSAPECANAADPSLFRQRHRAYAHFGIAVPAWDPAPQAPAKPAN